MCCAQELGTRLRPGALEDCVWYLIKGCRDVAPGLLAIGGALAEDAAEGVIKLCSILAKLNSASEHDGVNSNDEATKLAGFAFIFRIQIILRLIGCLTWLRLG